MISSCKGTKIYLLDISPSQVFNKVYHVIALFGDGQTVCDEEHGLVWTGGKEPAVEFPFGGFVERTADLVKQQDMAWAQQSSGDGDALCLSLTQPAAPLTQFGVQSVGQFLHEVGTSDMQHLSQFVVGSVGLSQLQVITDSPAHQRVPLRHETEVTTHLYLSFRRLYEAED